MPNEKYLILDNDGFFVKDERFSYEDVESIYFDHTQTQKTINFTASGIDHSVVVKLYVKGRTKPLVLEAGPQWFSVHGFSLGKKASDMLISKVDEIRQRTFNQRADRYMKSLRENGYFVYNGKKIYEN